MAYIKSYKKLSALVRNESFEPRFNWGVRMALSGTLPVLWGVYSGHVWDSVWIALTAEAVCWVELKGAFTWRVRTLFAAAVLAIFFSMLGSVTGNYLWAGVPCIFAVGILGTLLKSMGDRASGLALCVYMMFIFSNAYPVVGGAGAWRRLQLLVVGASWPLVTGIALSLFTPGEEPFRRQIALIWRAVATLAGAVATRVSDHTPGNTASVYTEENDVRIALDNSYSFFGRMAHQISKANTQQQQLAQLRKIAGMLTVNLTGMGEELAKFDNPDAGDSLLLKAATLIQALTEAISRISVYIITLEPEEKLLAVAHINRAGRLSALLGALISGCGARQDALKRFLQLAGRSTKLMESALLKLENLGADKPVFKSFSLLKTIYILHPRFFLSNIRMALHPASLNARYALRSAIAVTIGYFIYKWFHVEHGYWIPFSIMIVIQPYFGATFRKAIDRVAGTTLGVVAGGLLLHLPTGLYLKEGILFLTFVGMVYFIKKKYATAVFFITLNIVLLFHIESAYSDKIMIYRALCTVCGALLAVGSGFAFFPTWDRKRLPVYLSAAIQGNYLYFTTTFYAPVRDENWTKNKRNAETANSNVFDSFNRFVEEPGAENRGNYFALMTSCVRIAQYINSINLEQDEKNASSPGQPEPAQQAKINECLYRFRTVYQGMHADGQPPEPSIAGDFLSPFALNTAQLLSLEKIIIELQAMQAVVAVATVNKTTATSPMYGN